jgi:hypothetical protein
MGGQFHGAADVGEFRQILFGGLVRRDTGVLDFEYRADLMKVFDAHVLTSNPEQQPERLYHLVAIHCAHGCSNAMPRFEQTLGSQDTDCFSDDGSRDAELFGKLALGGKALADGYAAFDDLIFNRLHNAIDETVLSPDHFEARLRTRAVSTRTHRAIRPPT